VKTINKAMNCLTLPLAPCLLGLCLLSTLPAAADEPDAEEARLLDVLRSDAPAGRKAEACFRLKQVGKERSVPVLAALLSDPATAHPARLALESMPYPSVDAALREALRQVEERLKIGIAITLGQRGNPESVPVLTELVADADPEIAVAAADALGRIGGAAALAAVQDAWEEEQRPQAKKALGDALARHAGQRLSDGDRAAARAIYRELAAAGAPRPLRMAGLRGILRAADDGGAEVLAMLRDEDRLLRQVGAAHIAELPADALPPLARAVGEMPPVVQEVLLETLAARREPSLRPAALAAARGDRLSLQLAGLRALSAVGDVSAVEPLVDALLHGNEIGEAARWSLLGLRANGIDDALVAALQDERLPARRAALLDVLLARRAKVAVPVFLNEAAGPDAEPRSRAIEALARLAAPSDLPALVELRLKTERGRHRDDVERAIMLVCQKVPDPEQRGDAVLAAARAAGSPGKAVLLPLLGRIGGRESLAQIQAAIESNEPELHEAGLRALCNWPDATVADQLLQLATNAANDTHRQWALRAFVRVITLPSETPATAKLALLKQAMPLAARDEDRGLILERAAAVRTVETLRFVAPYLDQPALAQVACRTIVELAHHKDLREPNRAEFIPALEKVIAACKDQQLVDRAERYRQEM